MSRQSSYRSAQKSSSQLPCPHLYSTFVLTPILYPKALIFFKCYHFYSSVDGKAVMRNLAAPMGTNVISSNCSDFLASS